MKLSKVKACDPNDVSLSTNMRSKGNPAKKKPKESTWIALESGRYEVTLKCVYRDQPNHQRELICGYIRFISHISILGSDQVQVGILIRDCHGVRKNLIANRSDLLNTNRLIDRLSDSGWEIHSKKETAQFLVELYRKCPPKKTILTTPTPGWHSIAPGKLDIYVTNQGTIKPSDCNVNVTLADGISAGFASSGDISEWNLNVGDLCVGNSRLQFGVCFALASLIVRFSGYSNFGALLYGPSKSGKTVTLKVAASVIGDEKYVCAWNATSNALEIIAVQRNDGLLPLDEIGQGDPKAVSEAVYDLMNGRTKSRLGSDIKLDSGWRFVVLVLATGEHDLRTHLKLAGIEVKEGQSVRLFSIPVPQSGIFFNLHGHPNVGAFASTLAQNTARYYGTLGPAFIAHIAQNQTRLKAELPEKIREVANYLLSLLSDIPDHGTYNHIAKSFALVAVAGEMAIANGFLTWNNDDAMKAVEKCFKAWAKREKKIAGLSDNDVFKHLQRFFQSEKAGKFVPLSDFEPANKPTLAGYLHKIDGAPVYLIYPAYFETILCRRFSKTDAVRVLKERDLLTLGVRNTPTKQVHIPISKQQGGQTKVSFYVIREEILRT